MFDTANSGVTFGVVPTDYGYYSGELKNGEPLAGCADHFIKQDNSWFYGIVEKTKREGEGINYAYNNESELSKITIGYWKKGKLFGHAEQDDYALHQHFVGNYSDDHRCGKGILTDTVSGKSYEGNWKNRYTGDCLYGMVVERNLRGEMVYNGEYKNSNRHGFGIEQCENGCVYKGYWRKGLRHGKGEMQIPESDEIYKQTWRRGSIKKGKAVEWNQNGEIVFNGNYKNNNRDGFGTEQCENGCVYRGYWKNGQKHGEGVLYVPNSNESYKETWKKGKIIKCQKL